MSSSINSTNAHQQRHVAVLAFPYGTHAAPLLGLVRRISAAAPEVLFSFFSTASSNKTLFSGSPHAEDSNIRAHEVPDGLPAGYVFGGNPEEPVNKFLEAAEESFTRAVGAAEVASGRRISCLVADLFFSGFAAEMAEEMHVPWVAIFVGGPRSLVVHLNSDIICHKMGSDVQEDTMLDFVPGFSALPAGDILEMVTHNPKSTLSTALHKIGSTLPRAAAVALNTWEELDPSLTTLKSKLKELLCVGPLVLASPPSHADTYGCLDWLDRHKPGSVAYVAFGSVALPLPDELAAIAESLQETETPFVWSMRPNDESRLPKSFLSEGAHKGKMVSWTPQLKVLEHAAVGAFVTHGGWNSIMESIISEVPMICRGIFGDHKVNARAVQDVWRIGFVVEGGRFTKTGTTEALRRVLSGEEGVKMKENINVLKEPAFKAVEPNGSSTQNFKTLASIVTE